MRAAPYLAGARISVHPSPVGPGSIRESRGLPGSSEHDAKQHAGRDEDDPGDHQDRHFEGDEVIPEQGETDERHDRKDEAQAEQPAGHALDSSAC